MVDGRLTPQSHASMHSSMSCGDGYNQGVYQHKFEWFIQDDEDGAKFTIYFLQHGQIVQNAGSIAARVN